MVMIRDYCELLFLPFGNPWSLGEPHRYQRHAGRISNTSAHGC